MLVDPLTHHREALRFGRLIEAGALDSAFVFRPIDAAMHFCAQSSMGVIETVWRWYRHPKL